MYHDISSTRPHSFKFALLSAAIGAGFAMPAQAAFVSAMPAGSPLVVISAGGPMSSYDLDLNSDGKFDFTITSSGGPSLLLMAANGNTIDSYAYSASPVAYASTADFISTSAAKNNSSTYLDTLTAQRSFAELRFVGTNNAVTRGYVQGIYSSGPDGESFTLRDFGSEVVAAGAAVPEPGSLALLAAGAAGIVALRRRRNKADRAI